MDEPAMFAQPRRKTGATESLLQRTMRAWNAEGILTGDTGASARGILRVHARMVDAALTDYYAGECSARSVSQVTREYREALASYHVAEAVTASDSIDDLIAAISGPAVRDAAE